MSGQRSIFEDVSGSPKDSRTPAQPGAAETRRRGARQAIRVWQIILFALVVIMILVGGLTRLTDSGLSITEWAPVMGAIPPLGPADWDVAFAKYMETPEFRLVNSAMSLDEFKVIFWWEWGHRALGRIIGLVWFVGMAYFLLRKAIPVGWFWRLAVPGLLGGLQGAIGWWMVASGLTGEAVDVASYRLATHLGLAFVILGLLAWNVRLLGRDEVSLLQSRRQRVGPALTWSTVLLVLVFAQILLGALVAGIDAGRGYIDWPLMGGEFLPSESFNETPLWRNFFENPALVQFNHRMMGYLILVVGLVAFWRMRGQPLSAIRRAFTLVLAMIAVQTVMGIVTVLYAAPLNLAIVHQAGAIVLFSLVIAARFDACYPAQQRIAGAS